MDIHLTYFFSVILVLLINIFDTHSADDLHFDGKRYLMYNPSRRSDENFNINRINLEFRTIEPNGVLVMMKGKGRDTITLKMVQGRLRYTISRASSSPMEVTMGSNLCDNTWHKVIILRTERINNITLDGESKIFLSSSTLASLTANTTFLIGGSSSRSTAASSIHRTFLGCMRLNNINNRDPISYLKSGNNRVRMLSSSSPNSPISAMNGKVCSSTSRLLVTLGLIKSRLLMRHNLSRTDNGSRLNFGVFLRTFYPRGRIVLMQLNKVVMKIGLRKSKVFASLKHIITNATVNIQMSKPVNDGLWHTLAIEINRRNTSWDVILTCDGVKTTTDFPSNTTIVDTEAVELRVGATVGKSDSFVGCLHDWKLNEQLLKERQIESKIATDDGVVLDRCTSVVDVCHPNPCQNGGVCKRKNRREYYCDCRGTDFYGERCETYKYASVCSEYQELGLREESYCLLDSDGVGNLDPYTSICRFDETKMATIVNHNKPRMFDANQGQKFFTYKFHHFRYEMDEYNINSLIENSDMCRQRVYFKCYKAIMFNNTKQNGVAWATRDGQVKRYWGGVTDTPTGKGKGCACGRTGNCRDASKLCNCDVQLGIPGIDEGYLTEKKYLPINRIQIQGIETGGAYIQVGPLECYGTKNKIKRRSSRSPSDVSRILREVCVSTNDKNKLLEKADQMTNNILQREEELPNPKLNRITENNDASRRAEDSLVPSRKYEDKFDEFQDTRRSRGRTDDLNESRDLNKDTDLISLKSNGTSSEMRKEKDPLPNSDDYFGDDEFPESAARTQQWKSQIRNKIRDKSIKKRFGVLEITFVSLAGVATTILFLKYLLYDRFCRRNDRGELILNQLDEYDRRDDHMGTMSSAGTMSSRNGPDCPCNCRRITRNPINAYWV